MRAAGAVAYFFEGGTTTPFVVYEDMDESTAHEHPLEADASARWPLVSIPFITTYDVRVLTAEGTQLYYHREIPNPSPVEESEDTVDDTQLLQTGDWLFTGKAGTRSGFVRANGGTIGSATSGASERANADCEDLFIFLWGNHADTICPVVGGRGGSAAADWAANKKITVYNAKGGSPRGVDDMGGTDQSSMTISSFINGGRTTAGSEAGSNVHVLVEDELPSNILGLDNTYYVGTASVTGTISSGGSNHAFAADVTNSVNDLTNPQGDDDPHTVLNRSILGYWLLKL